MTFKHKNKLHHHPEYSELGRVSDYEDSYNPEKLFVISRQLKRDEIGVDSSCLPFHGFDCWHHYEVSWLNEKGKPIVAIAQILYECTSPYMVESKSLKLYFNSFSNTKFHDINAVRQLLETDLKVKLETTVYVNLYELNDPLLKKIQPNFEGENIDALDIICDEYQVNAKLLTVENEIVTESLSSDLLKSNCLVTHQPDWGSVSISYTGRKINREGLLRYIVSFRNHNEFHEQCIERIYMDIMRQCKPEILTVLGCYTRRGGIDINPMRTSSPIKKIEWNYRLIRQ